MYIIKNGFILTSDGEKIEKDILIQDKRIIKIADHIEEDGAEVINAYGQFVSAGLIDVHVHLREPGFEYKETIATGSQSAARGGYTTICAMPNTKPVPDTKVKMMEIANRIHETAHVRVLPYASITTSLGTDKLVDFSGLVEAGAFAFTDDGVGVQLAGTMYEAMQQAAKLNKAIVAHCEDNSLVYGGVVHEGLVSQKLALNGIPNIAESVQIARDVLLAEAAGCHYHVCHISTKESVRVVRDAKRAGIHVTAEVTPHHLLLNEEDIPGDNGNWKMNPPLRSKEDQQALLDGLMDGTIDFIATDHAPHAETEKNGSMKEAAFGIVGLETAFPLLYSKFVKTGKWTLKQLIDWMTIKPAQAFSLPYGDLKVGDYADIVIFDLEGSAPIGPQQFYSKGRNTPFAGEVCCGFPNLTMYEGKVVYRKGE